MTLLSLNEDIASLAAKASASVVEVRARRGTPSSGVAFSEDGLMVAAEHTIEVEEDIEIAREDGEVFPAELLGRDPSTGVALLRARKGRLVPPVWRESSEPGALELALILASSKSARRLTLAAVRPSARGWDDGATERAGRYLDIDTNLFPGFSGSLLLDAAGQGIGLTTAGLRRRRPLAIPVSTLRRVAKSLLEHGEVRRGFLGVTTYPVRLPATVPSQRTGLLVLSVQDGSPAHEAGLFLGDVILSVEKEPIESPHALLRHLSEDRIGKPLEARILRAGEQKPVSIKVGARS